MAINKHLLNPASISRIDPVTDVLLDPPVSPSDGDRYIIANRETGEVSGVPTGLWENHLGEIATSVNSGTEWVYDDLENYEISQDIIVINTDIWYRWCWVIDPVNNIRGLASFYKDAGLLTKSKSDGKWYQRNSDGTLTLLIPDSPQSANLVVEYARNNNKTENILQRKQVEVGGFKTTPVYDNAVLVPGTTDRVIDFLPDDGSFTVNKASLYQLEFRPYIYVGYDYSAVSDDLNAAGLPAYTSDHINGVIQLAKSATGDDKLLFDAGYKNYPVFMVYGNVLQDSSATSGGTTTHISDIVPLLLYNNERLQRLSMHVPLKIQTVLYLNKGDKVSATTQWVNGGNSGELKLHMSGQKSAKCLCKVTELK